MNLSEVTTFIVTFIEDDHLIWIDIVFLKFSLHNMRLYHIRLFRGTTKTKPTETREEW